MNVRVINCNGSIWHKGKTYKNGDVIVGLSERVANSLMESLVCIKEPDRIDEVEQTVIVDTHTGEIIPDKEAKESNYAYDTDEKIEVEELGDVDEDQPSIAPAVDDSIDSIIESITELPKRRGRPRK